MISTLLSKIQKALRNDDCRYCQETLVRDGLLCPNCKTELGFRPPEPYVSREGALVYAATTFNPRMKRLIYPYKFYNRHEYAETLSDILIDYWRDIAVHQQALPFVPPSNVWVVPVPGRWHASHVAPIAARFAGEFGYGFNDALLQWARETMPQHTITGLSRRIANVHNSLAVDEAVWPRPSESLPGAPAMILVLDDLTTTGATLSEAVKAFRRCALFQGTPTALAVSHMPLTPKSR